MCPFGSVGVNQQCRPPERRAYPRITVPLQAEFRLEGHNAPIRVKTSDISLGGCYVEMMFTLEVGSILDIVLWLSHEQVIRARGVVVTRHPQFGNGIQFLSLPAEDSRRLERFLDSMLDAPTPGSSDI